MSQHSFEGVSNIGDFNEALNDAIANAKQNLKTDFVKWELEKMTGEDGGFIVVHIIRVKILAQAG